MTMTTDDLKTEEEENILTSQQKDTLCPNTTVIAANAERSVSPTEKEDIEKDNQLLAPSMPKLNYSIGIAATALDKLVGHADIERARSRNKAKRKLGESNKEMMKAIKKLNAAGQLIMKGNTHEIGESLLHEHDRRVKQTQEQAMKIQQKNDMLQAEKRKKLADLRARKPDESTWNNAELRIAIQAVKNRNDAGTMGTKQTDLLTCWEKFRPRAHLIGLPEKQMEATSTEGANDEGNPVMPVAI